MCERHNSAHAERAGRWGVRMDKGCTISNMLSSSWMVGGDGSGESGSQGVGNDGGDYIGGGGRWWPVVGGAGLRVLAGGGGGGDGSGGDGVSDGGGGVNGGGGGRGDHAGAK